VKHRTCCILACALLLASLPAPVPAQNLLDNPGFEGPTVSQGSALDNWLCFGSGVGGICSESTVDPRSGFRHLELITFGRNQFAGAFQLLGEPIAPGDFVLFTGFHRAFGPLDATIEIKLEWRGTPNPPPSRLDLLDLVPTYEQFTHAVAAPAGTTGLAVSYALSSFGAGEGDPTTVHIDDFSVVNLPEPSSLGALAAGMFTLARVGRRRSRRRASPWPARSPAGS